MDRRTFLFGAAGSALGLRSIARAAGAARTGRALALATADDDASVVALDLLGGAVVARVRTPVGPSSIETVGGGRFALVGHAASGLVSLLDVESLRVVRVLDGFGEPRYTAAGPDGRYAYVTDAARGELAVIDLVRERVRDRVAVGALARHVTISPDGATIWAALGPKAGAIAVVDAADPARPRLARTATPVDRAHDVVHTLGANRVWVTSGVERRIAVHDARTSRPLLELAADGPPQHVAMAAGRVFVASGADGTLRVYDADTARLLRTTRIPLGSYNVTAAFGRVVTPSLELGTVTTIELDGRFVRRETVTRQSHDAAIVFRS